MMISCLLKRITDNMNYRYIKKILMFFLLLTPVFFGMGIVLKYGVNVPFWDDFDLVPLISDKGGISLRTLFSQHNEHRMFFPRIVFIIIGYLTHTHMNMKAYMLFSQMLVAVSYFSLCIFINNIKTKKNKYLMMLLIGFLIYSPVQHENQLWGFQVGFYMVSVFTVLSIYFMHKSVNMREKDFYFLILSLLCAIVSSFSSIHGLLVWFAVDFVYLLHYRKKVFKNIRFIIWNIFAVSSWALYFFNYHKPPGTPSLLSGFRNPKEFIIYILYVVGHPLFTDRYYIFLFGLLTIIVCLILLLIFIRYNNKSDFFPMTLIVFGLMVAVSIAVGRVGFGIQQALSSRYTTFTLSIVIGICLFIFNKRLSFPASKIIITIIILSLSISSYSFLKNEMIQTNEYNNYNLTILINYKDSTNEDLVRLFPNINDINLVQEMEQQGMGPFKNLDKSKKHIINVPIPQDIIGVSVNDIFSNGKQEDILVLNCGIYDPFICLPLQESIDKLSYPILEIKYSNSTAGTIQIFFDYGNGWSQNNSIIKPLINSEKSILRVPILNWNEGTKLVSVRIDPPDGTRFELESILLYGYSSTHKKFVF